MKTINFFNNLQVFFKDEDEDSASIEARVYRNKNGTINEIRIFNKEYNEFLVIEKNSTLLAINVAEYEEEKIKKIRTKKK